MIHRVLLGQCNGRFVRIFQEFIYRYWDSQMGSIILFHSDREGMINADN